MRAVEELTEYELEPIDEFDKMPTNPAIATDTGGDVKKIEKMES